MKKLLLILSFALCYCLASAQPPPPQLTDTIYGRDTICQGETTPLSVVTLLNSGTVHYLWTPLTGLSCDTCDSTYASPTVTTTYTLIITDSLNADTLQKTITVNTPTTASVRVFPNGDTTYYTSLDTAIYIPHVFCPYIFVKEGDILPNYFVALPVNGGSNPTYRWMLDTLDLHVNADTLNSSVIRDSLYRLYNSGIEFTLTCTMISSLPCSNGPITAIPDTITTLRCPSGIETLGLEKNIALYPNPSNGRFVLSITQPSKTLNIALLNLQGQQLYTEQLMDVTALQKEYNFPGLAKGLYLLKISTENGVAVKRVVVQ